MVITCKELKTIDENLIKDMRKTISLIVDMDIRIKLFNYISQINIRLTLDHTIPTTLKEY